MIKYALLCEQDHEFEAWFPDSGSFDRQNEARLIACPDCGGTDVRKAVMAPAVRRSRRAAPRVAAEQTAAAVPPEETGTPRQAPPETIADEAFGKVRTALQDLHTRLKQNAENVGAAFSDQARRIHEGEAPARAIYGTATQEEVRSLVEDGVAILPIPALPQDRN